MKAAPGNARKEIEAKAQRAADKISGLPTELKAAAATAAQETASELKQRATSKSKQLAQDKPE